ncbi:MAG: response regulator [Oscillatoriaceae bacterium SKW80]|nr:response regulator [Oscillatoriaceae bacterium SKYG93]MCX8122200.1 response regulator [Oscillatoriaceae bacterium SKW80]MDW8454486.1 response regulator [Oscillatoriaceae cyanobacterium SKYGB_i_bin93]HIK29347.1 response regulator [Oscillatoriaceae cyanobacterium M7585_C2015_266]
MSAFIKPVKNTNINILVVDDNVDNVRLLSHILASQGYFVRKSLNGKIAIEVAHRVIPDLILLDINMPGMDGYEVCQHLKASEVTRHIPIIFISAFDRVNDKVRAFEMGGHDYITKPFQEQEVLARIRNQLIIQQQRQQLIQQQQLLIQKNQQLEKQVQERQRAEDEVKRLNCDLERRIQDRTIELQQALNFEATIKRIFDRLRDSLDSHKILQYAVEELAAALNLKYCNALLYGSDSQSSTICYQSVASGLSVTQEQKIYMADATEIHKQLQQQKCWLVFCQIQPPTISNNAAILACPIFDDRVEETGILGVLWLFKDTGSIFDEMEIHLVQQVANQCALGLRQARLYELAQAQVRELQRLNYLKNDFLCTISHELRSPIASMKMVIKLLISTLQQERDIIAEKLPSLAHSDKALQYLQVLQEECDRELSLVEDLLNLQYLEAGTYSRQLSTLNLRDWIEHVIEPFHARTQNQQQIFRVNIAPDLPTTEIDSISVSRIITELLTNACKYTPTGETISLTVNIIRDETPNQPCFLQIIITNTGVEIPSEELPRIFDKFYRIPNNDPWKYGGTGLGLALVQKLIQQSGGSLTVESLNNLTQFIVRLPI